MFSFSTRIIILLIISFAGFAAISCGEKKLDDKANLEKIAADTANFTTVQWLDTLVDLGTVTEGSKNEIKFRFRNTGDKPLYIISAKPGCGCTLADYPTDAIEPGNEAAITAVYEAEKGHKTFHKSVVVTTNTTGPKRYILYFQGNIKSKSDSLSKRADTTQLNKGNKKNLNKKDLILEPINK